MRGRGMDEDPNYLFFGMGSPGAKEGLVRLLKNGEDILMNRL